MFEVTARLKIRDGELDGFKRQAGEVMRLAREKDTKTVRYDWFINADGTECEVREGYVDADGLLEHNEHVQEARDQLFLDHAYGHDMTIYGDPSPALAELMERMSGHVPFHRYSLWQGLENHAEAKGMFEATAHLKIREGQLEGFKQQAAEVLRQMNALEDPPLRYDWFLSEDGTECEVRETYVDSGSLLEHQLRIKDAKMKLIGGFVVGHEMAFYGELSPALAQMLSTLGAVYTVFSFLQGLDADVDVLAEVHA